MNMYVGNLSRTATEEALRGLFERYGQVTSVKIIKDHMTGEARGFAFVDMSNEDEAQQAMAALNNYDFEGQQLRVNEARERRPNGPRTGGFGGPRGGGNRGGSTGGFGGPRSGGFGGSRSGGSTGGFGRSRY